MLGEVELGWNYGWNYMKFHPNSTSCKPLIIKVVTSPRWNGGITNDKIYFSENRVGKVLMTIKMVYLMDDPSLESLASCVLVTHHSRSIGNG